MMANAPLEKPAAARNQARPNGPTATPDLPARRRFMANVAALAGHALLSSAAVAAQPAPRTLPNILLILADDLGYGDLGCYGQKDIFTPNLDRLAKEGIRFTSAYAGCTVCAPSRCALMTGLHTGHAKIRGNGPNEILLSASDYVLPEMLKKAGYATGLFGKWGLGGLGYPGYPTRKGWDRFFGYFSQLHAHTYYPEHLLDNDTAYLCMGNFGGIKKDYAPDLFAKNLLSFIEQNARRPFFAFLSTPIPHANNELGRYSGDGIEIADDAPYSGKSWPKLEKKFAATVTYLDRQVGQILAKLDELGLADNTLVIFSSDNGPHKEGGHDPRFFSSSGVVRGTKRDMTEGGIRVPAIMRWRNRIKPGQVNDQPWAFWDLFSTFAELTGQPAPKPTDGVSIAPLLLGQGKYPASRDFYWEFHENGFFQALRSGNWKLIRKNKTEVELYDLAQDLGETRNLATQMPEVTARLLRQMEASRTESPDFPAKTTAERQAAKKG